ncbi:hypothetical protein J4226_03740 [Candidatus Pacearchaeota archaeon]|nr:hypothetical protein [Candidatus Pacearchaeota archaeon]
MFAKKCRGCAEKVDKKFNYCPHCGASMKAGSEEDFGMLGMDDSGRVEEELRLPFGVEKIMGSLVKQLEKQLENMEVDGKTGMPKNFKIQIARGPMRPQVVPNGSEKRRASIVVSREEAERRSSLEKVNAESRVKRLGDVIIYEIEAPGIQKSEDVVVTELETGVEIRAYARDKCYIKTIPMKVEILGMRIDREKVSVEMRG